MRTLMGTLVAMVLALVMWANPVAAQQPPPSNGPSCFSLYQQLIDDSATLQGYVTLLDAAQANLNFATSGQPGSDPSLAQGFIDQIAYYSQMVSHWSGILGQDSAMISQYHC